MKEDYLRFFEKVFEIYKGVGGYCTLMDAINSGKLKDGLNEREYQIATFIISDFFETRRTFGISEHEINGLAKKCEQIENPNTALREA